MTGSKTSWTSVRSSHELWQENISTRLRIPTHRRNNPPEFARPEKRWAHNWQFECKNWIDLMSAATSFFMGSFSTPSLSLPSLLRRWGTSLTPGPWLLSRGRTRLIHLSHPTLMSPTFSTATSPPIYFTYRLDRMAGTTGAQKAHKLSKIGVN